MIPWGIAWTPGEWGYSSGPGGIRTLDFFSAIEEQVGEKGEKAVYYVYFVPKSPYCSSISVPELFPQYEARKGDLKPFPEVERDGQ
jgi:hypothetical protein